MQLLDLANPTRFLSITARLMPFLIGATLIAFGVGLYMAFFVAPPDYQQGDTVRIMFVHVPAAWLGMFGYTIMTAAASPHCTPPPAEAKKNEAPTVTGTALVVVRV